MPEASSAATFRPELGAAVAVSHNSGAAAVRRNQQNIRWMSAVVGQKLSHCTNRQMICSSYLPAAPSCCCRFSNNSFSFCS